MATVARPPDAELLRRLRARDRTAWEELYAEYQPRLRAFAYRLAGNPHDADDLVQETFLRAVPRLDRLDPETTDVAAYLFATQKNLFLKQVEKRKRQEPMADVPEPDVPAHIEDDPERSLLLARQQDEVRLANAHLQPRQRLVLALRELEDRSYAEIGELVGMKENAVAQLIFRARESLRTELRLAQVDPESLPEECRRFLPLLAAHLDGQLKGAKRDETLAHLEGCERCQAALADMQEASRRYRTLFPMPFGAEEARAATDERLEATGYWQQTACVLESAPAAPRCRAPCLRAGARSRRRSARRGAGARRCSAGAPPHRPRRRPRKRRRRRRIPARRNRRRPSPRPSRRPPPRRTETTEPPEPTEPPTSPVTQPPTEPTVTTESKPEPKPSSPPNPQPPCPRSRPPPPDTKAPIVTITSGPGAATSTDAAQIGFKANEAGVTFSCSFDGAAFAACSSPVALTALSAGKHQFSVRGTDKAGNVGHAGVRRLDVHAARHDAADRVDHGGAAVVHHRRPSASFSFTSNEAGATFACSLDGGAFAPCASPVSYRRSRSATHDFVVRATDAAGNVGPTDDHQWTVVQPLPDLYVSQFTAFSITCATRAPRRPAPRRSRSRSSARSRCRPSSPAQSITFRWSTCRRGTYSAIVDRTNVVIESDEKNNTATRQSTCI